jgi:hypothetical protein
MAMSTAALKAFIITKMQEVYGDSQSQEERENFAEVIGEIVDYVTTNAVVTIPLGIPVTTTGGDGATTAPGIGTIS